MIRVHQVLNNAAREGARLATSDAANAVYGTDPTKTQVRNQIIAQVKSYVSVNMKGYDDTKITVTISPDKVLVTNPNTGVAMATTVVTVQYQYALQYLPAFSLGIVSNTFNLGAKAQFRNLN
jgi:hypothetical protein